MLTTLFQQNLHSGATPHHSSTSSAGQGGPVGQAAAKVAQTSDSAEVQQQREMTVYRKYQQPKKPWRHKRAIDMYESDKFGRPKK